MRDMPRVAPFDRPATYDDLERLPSNMVGEIVDGELHASARPAFPHAHAGSAVGRGLLPAFDHPGRGGWRLLYEPELHLGDDTVVPDWAGWRRERMPRLPRSAFSTLAPDWVCEILSPSTEAFDRSEKLPVYAREGVSHAWLLDPLARTLEVLQLQSGRWSIVASHADDALIRIPPVADLEIRLREFWPDE